MSKKPIVSRVSSHLKRLYKKAFLGVSFSPKQDVLFIYMNPEIDLSSDPIFHFFVAEFFGKHNLAQVLNHLHHSFTYTDDIEYFRVWCLYSVSKFNQTD